MKKLLIIEDDNFIVSSVTDLFESEDFIVYQATNGIEGIEAAKNYLPDIILSDISMPGLNGYEVLMELQKDKKTSGIPFIFLTAKVEKIDFRMGMELGADDYITKPFKIEELLRAVQTRLKKNENKKPSFHASFSEPAKRLTDDEHIFIHDKGQPAFLLVSDILYITAEAEYSYIFLKDNRKILLRRLLKKWEQILPDKSFLRISRSSIINLNHLAKIEKWFNNSYVVYIKNVNDPLIISRRYAKALRSRLS